MKIPLPWLIQSNSTQMKFGLQSRLLTLFMLLTLFSSSVYAVNLESVRIPKRDHPTLNYTNDEIDCFYDLPKPNRLITSEQLSKVTKELTYFIDSTNIAAIDLTIMPAYIANAQKDFACLSYLITGELKGNLEPVTLWTLQLFVPEASLPSAQEERFDVFSSLLSALVVREYAKRLEDEKKQIKDYSIKIAEGFWSPTSPGYVGLDNGSVKTWFLTSSKEFMADTLPEDPNFWKIQTGEVKNEQGNLDEIKVKKVFEWGGLTALHAGNFEHYLYDYLEEKQLPVLDQLSVRALYLSAIADSNAAAFNSKYTFWVMRPSQRDSRVKPLILIPNHPSYPSAHSTISATASTIMSELFPEDSEKWNQMADEAGISRIWGGVHYPVDHLAGQKLGRVIGEAVLEKVSKNN